MNQARSDFVHGDPLPQSRAHALIGEDFLLGDAIVHGNGRIQVGDSSSRVAADEYPPPRFEQAAKSAW
jgi:membrane protein implicated in regulation of membrane protease activity